MTAFGLYPTFTDKTGYKAWRLQWSMAYKALSQDIRKRKLGVKTANQVFDIWYKEFETQNGGKPFLCLAEPTARMPESYLKLAGGQNELRQYRAMATKMMTLLEEAKERRNRIMQMHHDLEEQEKLFPLDLGECRNIDFHYNKGNAEFLFLPMWAIRVKGRSYYLNEVSFDAPCSTHGRASGSTKGVLRFARGRILIDKGATAKISTDGEHKMIDENMEAA
jgi:hypothetical protein